MTDVNMKEPRYNITQYSEDELTKVPTEWIRDWCDHSMTILTYWTTTRDETELTDQIVQLAKDIRTFMKQANLWNDWYDKPEMEN